jgi:cytochrome o ubiquinol oxidase subunit 2
VSPAQYAAWTNRARGSGPSLDEPAYGALARQSTNVAPFTYRAVSADLFEQIVQQRVAPGPGPEAASPAPRAQPRQRS